MYVTEFIPGCAKKLRLAVVVQRFYGNTAFEQRGDRLFLFFGEWLELNLEPGGVGLQSAGLYQVDYLDKT
jgi:hypothetical protein